MSDSPKTIVVIDYDLGNLKSISNAFDALNTPVVISNKKEVIQKADALILPGVGSFEAGMRGLKKYNLVPLIHEHVKNDKPLLGICLGAQLLMSTGNEFGSHEGLGIIPGSVEVFRMNDKKIPHVGWNTIKKKNDSLYLNHFGRSEEPSVYFVHSFTMNPKDPNHTLTETTYGSETFCSTVIKGKTLGCQYHPEKSGTVGLSIIKNFIDCI